MARNQVRPESSGRTTFCGVDTQYPESDADNHAMGFRFRRSVKILPGIRLNFGKRGISTSIGVRGAHVTIGKAGTRTTIGLPGSGLSYTHLERPHHEVSTAMAAEPPTNAEASPGSAWRGFLWIGLIVAALVIAIGRLTTPAPLVQMPAPRSLTPITAQEAAQTARDERLAEIKTAVLGVDQIRQAIANSSTLSLSRVTVTPTGAICYQFNLRNSRGVTYDRTAIVERAVLSVSGSDAFTALWNRRCVHQSGREVTSDVNDVIHR
jgi:hypothetical protein